jgi:hypothetical protein
MARKKQPRYDQPDGPAIVRPGHVRDRIISPGAGAPKAWRNLSPLEAAFAKGQLMGGSSRYTALQRFEAGNHYAMTFLVANGTGGRDSTQAMNVSQSSKGFEPPKSQHSALFMLAKIETHMGARDCRIIRRVCGEGHKPADVVRDVCADYRDTVSARFREALDGLIESLENTRALGRRS